VPSCKEISGLATALSEGSLAPAIEQTVRAHLGACSACRNFYAGMNGVGGVVKLAVRLESTSAPPALLSAFDNWATGTVRKAVVPGRLQGYGALALAFVLSLALGLFTAHEPGMGPMALGRSLVCSATHLVGALLPAALVFALGARRFIGRAPGLVGAAAGAGALVVQIIDHCPASTNVQHQLVFHTGAVLLAVATTVSVTRLWAVSRVRVG
jgi:predicted anti-sigma-YlaC factor YlaD